MYLKAASSILKFGEFLKQLNCKKKNWLILNNTSIWSMNLLLAEIGGDCDWCDTETWCEPWGSNLQVLYTEALQGHQNLCHGKIDDLDLVLYCRTGCFDTKSLNALHGVFSTFK